MMNEKTKCCFKTIETFLEVSTLNSMQYLLIVKEFNKCLWVVGLFE